MNHFQKRRVFHAKAGAKGGKRNGVYYRSRWEFNLSIWADELKRIGEITDWKYEDKEFFFEKIKRGVRYYRPDFHVFYPSCELFIECKGFLDAKSVTALARMARYYPEVKILLIDKKKYMEIESEFGHLPGWEKP